MSARQLKVAVIGAGMMGRQHAAAARRSGAIVSVIADADLLKAQELRSRDNNVAMALSIDELFAVDDLDAVHICTPPSTHFSLCTRAVQRGLAVLCEKPVTDNADQTVELMDKAAAKNVVVCPVHQFPFQNGVERVIRSRQRIGPIRHLVAELCTAGAEGLGDRERQAVACNVLPHPLSLFRAFGLTELSGVEWRVSFASPGEFVVTGPLAGRLNASILISTRGRPTRNSLKVIGETGTATIDLFHGFSIVESGAVSRARKVVRPFAESALTFGQAAINGARRAFEMESGFPGLRTLISKFYASLADGSPPPISPAEVIDIARARDRIISMLPN